MQNNLEQFSDEELNLVTDYLLKSAKTRFNYQEFKKGFSDLEEEFIDYNILLKLITSKSAGQPNELIALEMLADFALSGYMVERGDLVKMINKKEKGLGMEILCTTIAMDSLQSGVHPTFLIQ